MRTERAVKQYPIPPIVDDMLGKLWNSGLAESERDNVALMLEEIERAVKREVTIYRRERAKQNRDRREEGRRSRSKLGLARVGSR